jgi:small-conductance mechanosensitive channel
LGGAAVLLGLGCSWTLGVAQSQWWGDSGSLRLGGWVGLWLLALLPAAVSGIAEDLTQRLTVRYRLALTGVSGLLAITLLDLTVPRLGLPWLDALLMAAPWLGLGIALLAVTGLPHAFNIIDGYNGLSGMVAIIVCLALAHVALQVGDRGLAALMVSTAAATGGFLVWNYPRGMLFAGDGGAYIWGVVIAVASISLVQRNADVSPWFPMLLLIYILAFGLCALALATLWRRPRPFARGNALWTRASWGWSIVLIGLLALWLAGLHVLLWLGIFAVALPKVLAACTKLVRGLQLYVNPEVQIYATRSILLDRVLRALIIAGAAWWIAHLLGLEASGMARGETIENRIARGLMQGVVVVLFADLIWAFAKAQIKMTLETASADAVRSDEQKRRASRLLTLLPIFRNILAAVIGIISVLMVLSGLGVEIAPLLAGAGVVGVAVGFGTQTIVKDVISGMFYLWDDAFRIDEYIETGKYKGTVESFSLRSVKLRHHRGPLTTVPFGELGAVQNMSRDWSVTKFNLRVGYDTDLEKLRKVIKKIGQDLAERPEYKDSIISPLKMKGVVDFGEYAIEVRVGFTTKPGEQFMIRRDAMTMIRQTFRENGIHFAVPTVQVSNPEDGDASAAALAKARHDAALQAAQEGGGA